MASLKKLPTISNITLLRTAIEKRIIIPSVSTPPINAPKTEVIEPPKHTHTWEPVYSNRQIEKIKMIPWTKCYACGADMTGNVNHIDEHLLNGDSNVHYGTEYREEMYYETEEYISGYKCSCGEIK